jgi:hypothetical protein
MEEIKRMAEKAVKRVMAYQAKDNVLIDRLITYIASKGWPIKRRWDTSDWHWVTFELPYEGLESLKVRVKRQKYGAEIRGIPGAILGSITPTSCEIKFTVIFKGRRLFFKRKKEYMFTMNLDEYINDELKVIDEEKLNTTFENYLKTIGF